jgi:hypothetical protein
MSRSNNLSEVRQMPELINIEVIAIAHSRLMQANLNVLTRVETLGFFVSLAPREERKWWQYFGAVRSIFTIRYLVALFVQSHIKMRSDELRSAYIQMAQPIVGADQKEAKKWLMETAISLEAFSKTLDSWSSIKGIFNLTWPVVVGFFLAWTQADNLYMALLTLSLPPVDVLLAAAVVPITYIGLFLFSAFQCKRVLLRPKEESALSPLDLSGLNIYALEDELFQHIRRRKVREFPLDILSYVVGAGTFGTVPIYFAMREPTINWTLIASGSFFLLCSIVVALSLRNRRWR